MNNNKMNIMSIVAIVVGILGIILGGVAIFLGMQNVKKIEKKLIDLDTKTSSMTTDLDKIKKEIEAKANSNKSEDKNQDVMLPVLTKAFADLSKKYQEDATKFIEGNGISVAKVQKEFLDNENVKTTLQNGKWAFTVNNNQIHLTYTSNNSQEKPLNYALEINGVSKQFTVKSLNAQAQTNTNGTNNASNTTSAQTSANNSANGNTNANAANGSNGANNNSNQSSANTNNNNNNNANNTARN
jgi:putative uncharacterized protein DDB_G0289263